MMFLLPAVLYAIVWLRAARARPDRVVADLGAHAATRPRASADSLAPTGPHALAGSNGLLALALILHAGTFVLPWQPGHFHYGFAKLSSVTVWFGVLMLWVQSIELGLRRTTAVVMPVAIVTVLLPLVWPGAVFSFAQEPPLFVPHLIAGTLAYGLMFLAALHALLMAAVERRLHPRHPGGGGRWSRLLPALPDEMPPLLALERTLFRFIGLGFVLLLVTTLTGMLFSEETFGRPLRIEHKTVFSLIATTIFGCLLAGRHFRGWRGRRALRWAGWGFAILLLSYVGSRFVLEVLLDRVGG